MSPRSWASGGLILFAFCSCAHIEVDRRVDRGPTLRHFEREQVGEGGLAGQVEVAWPRLMISVLAYDLCRNQKVEEYAEEITTERSAPSAGPALALGVTDTLIGAGLYLANPLFSNAPNTRSIDRGGRYGPSDRQVAAGWSYGLMIVGVPALVVGIIGYAQVGEEVETRKAQQVVSATERRCRERPVGGEIELADRRRVLPPVRRTLEGKAVFSADELRGRSVDPVLFAKRPLEVEEPGMALLQAFLACANLASPEALTTLSVDALSAELAAARLCRAVEAGPGPEAVRSIEAEAARRGADELAEAAKPGPRLESYQDALAAYAPRLHFFDGSEQLHRLARPAELVSVPVTLTGILVARPERNIGLLQVGPHQALLFVPPDVPWAFDFAVGSRLEVLGVAMGEQALGEIHAPLFRAVWARPVPSR